MVVHPLSNHESCPVAGKYRFTSPSRSSLTRVAESSSILLKMKLVDGLRKRSRSYVVCCVLL